VVFAGALSKKRGMRSHVARDPRGSVHWGRNSTPTDGFSCTTGKDHRQRKSNNKKKEKLHSAESMIEEEDDSRHTSKFDHHRSSARQRGKRKGGIKGLRASIFTSIY